jgi:hypothetical protein
MKRAMLVCILQAVISLGLVQGAQAEQPNCELSRRPHCPQAGPRDAAPPEARVLMAALQIPVAALTPDFTLTLSQQALSVTRGQSGSVTVQANDQNGFDSSITLSCVGMPAGTTCTFTPATIDPSGMATLKITASQTVSPYRSVNGSGMMGAMALGGIGLLGIVAPGWRSRRLPEARPNSWVWRLSWAILLLGLLIGAAGCGYNSKSMPTAVGTKDIQVMGVSGMLSHTVPLSLTVL